MSAKFTLAIQAGGVSHRMGCEKCSLRMGGISLIEHVIAHAAPLADETIIITNTPEALFFLPDNISFHQDKIPGVGILGGLLTALHVAVYPYVMAVGCDMPFLCPPLLGFLCQAMLDNEVDVVIPRSTNGLEPLHAIYRRQSCLPAVEQAIHKGQKSMSSWFSAVRVLEVSVSEVEKIDPEQLSFINLNTPEEFNRAERLFLSRSHSQGSSKEDPC